MAKPSRKAAKAAPLGSKVRRLRRRRGLTQVQMARDLGISGSYLNLIEHDQRPLTVPLLLKLAEVYRIDVAELAARDDLKALADLREVFGDPLFEDRGPGDEVVAELASSAPEVATAVAHLYQAFRAERDRSRLLAERLSDGEEVWGAEAQRMPTEEVTEFLQAARNHFPELEERALEHWARGEVHEARVEEGLARHLEAEHGIAVEIATTDRLRGAVRRMDSDGKRLLLSEILPDSSRRFQLAHQVALLTHGALLDELASSPRLSSPEARALGRVALANSFAGALLMPYPRFLAESRRVRYDVELLEHRFGASFEQVCHRLSTLNRPGSEGVPFHFLRLDIAGNISKRFSASGIRFARYGGACPRWNVHAAFLTPGLIRTQVSEMPGGETYFCIARTVRKAGGGFRVPQSRLAIGLGCDLAHARELVYADGIDLEDRAAAVPVGVSCRLCERLDCRQRAFPPVHHRFEVDEAVRGLSFYYEPEVEGGSPDGAREPGGNAPGTGT